MHTPPRGRPGVVAIPSYRCVSPSILLRPKGLRVMFQDRLQAFPIFKIGLATQNGQCVMVFFHRGLRLKVRQLSDFKGDELVNRVLALIDAYRPIHVSLVGGDPMVRYRELETLLPELEVRGIHTQIVTSAFRTIPTAWSRFKMLSVVVSIDGLQPEHDERRKPATYERTLKNITGTRVTIHCTITSQIATRAGYLDEFLGFWSSRPEIVRVWFSLFTPQRGAADAEILTPSMRASVIADLLRLRRRYPLLDMRDSVIREIASPPRNPQECIFARTTETVSADLSTRITACRFGGDP